MIDYVRAHFTRMVKFGVTGVVNTGVDFAVFWLVFDGLGLPVLWAHICGFCVAVVNSYLLNRYWAFGDRTPKHRNTFILFLAVTALGLGVSSLVLMGLVHYGASPYVAKIVATAASMMWNFCFYQGIVFQQSMNTAMPEDAPEHDPKSDLENGQDGTQTPQ